jgi:hypothetical protein
VVTGGEIGAFARSIIGQRWCGEKLWRVVPSPTFKSGGSVVGVAIEEGGPVLRHVEEQGGGVRSAKMSGGRLAPARSRRARVTCGQRHGRRETGEAVPLTGGPRYKSKWRETGEVVPLTDGPRYRSKQRGAHGPRGIVSRFKPIQTGQTHSNAIQMVLNKFKFFPI